MRYSLCLVVVLAFCTWAVPGLADATDAAGAQAALDKGDYRKARSLFREPATAGDLHAQFTLGRLLLQHTEMEGLAWIRKSAEAGHIAAQMQMALFCKFGHYTKEDERAFAGWLKRIVAHPRTEQARHVAASVDAKKLLSDAYGDGKGVPKDERKALALLKQAADEGHPLALYSYARHLELGDGITKDLVEAHKYFVLAWKAPYLVNWFGKDLNVGRREALSVRKKLTSDQFAESRARIRAWLAQQKAGKLGMGFQFERKLSRGLRKLENDESQNALAMILAPYDRPKHCQNIWIKSRKAMDGTPDRSVWTERWTLDECGTLRTYVVRLTRAMNRGLTVQIGDQIRSPAEFGLQ